MGKPKYWGKKVVKSDKYMGVSQLLGHVPGLPPKSTPMGARRTLHKCLLILHCISMQHLGLRCNGVDLRRFRVLAKKESVLKFIGTSLNRPIEVRPNPPNVFIWSSSN